VHAALLAFALAAPSIRVDYVEPLPQQPAREDQLWADDFDRAPSAPDRYFEYDNAKGSFVWDVKGGLGAGGAMRATFAQGQVNAGNLKVLLGRNPFGKGVRPSETFRELCWRVYMRNETGWQGSPAKLARLTCLAGGDWSQGLLAHVWSGKNEALCIDPATGIRGATKVSTKYNDFANLKWLGVAHGNTPIFSPAESGRWILIECRVRLNDPGVANGAFELSIDGKPEASRSNLDWHGTWTEYGINAFFLENYWNTGAVKRESRWFDGLAIGTRPLGPYLSSPSPVVFRTEGDSVWQVEVSDKPQEPAIWQSKPASARSVQVSQKLAPGIYWTRVRGKQPDGSWTSWSDWHAPFQVRG
jgi:hypothetical protein